MAGDSLAEDIEMILRNLDRPTFDGRRFLITGGAGFLGSWTCECLVALGGEVTCLDNMATGLPENIGHLVNRPHFCFLAKDATESIPGEFDYVLHMASRASPEEYQQHPIETLLANALGTRNALETARRSHCVMLFTSTSEVYGDAEIVPTPETYNGNVSPNGVRSCYDEGKRFGEALCAAYRREYGIDARLARIFNTYGPRLRGDGAYGRVVSRFLARALTSEELPIYGDGSQTRSFCYAADTVRGILSLLVSPKAWGETVNIGNPHEMTVLELARIVKKLTGSSSELRFHPLPEGDPRRRCPDISKASTLLDWSPQTTIQEGLEKTLQWLKEAKKPRF
jgi:UDP-glucuronate decarboxylase